MVYGTFVYTLQFLSYVPVTKKERKKEERKKERKKEGRKEDERI